MLRMDFWSKLLIPTLKETPQEAVIKSHRLMLRAGLVRKLASGTYSYLPLGFRALKKAEILVRKHISSYRQLPILLYQIQTKFRDEMRPRSGIIRSREFIMKDAYSFHADEACLDRMYQLMKETYVKIFKRAGLEFYIVQADP